MIPATGGASRVIVNGASTLDDMQLTSDGKTMIYTGESGSAPSEIFPPRRLAEYRSADSSERCLAAQYDLTPLDEFWVESVDKTRVQSFVVKPPRFQANQKYPVLFLIHGGPEGDWGESWTYRWNAQVFASTGI